MSFHLYRHCLSILPILLSVILIGALFYSTALSARVSFDPRVSAAVNYTDNIRLANSGDEEADRVFELVPGFLLAAESKYINAFLDYDLVLFSYKNTTDGNTHLNELNGALNSEIVPETFFLDANINNSQRTINSTGVVSDNLFTVTNNRADVFAFSISPYFQQRYGNYSSLLARYTYDRTRYSVKEDATITGQDPSGFNHRVLFELLSGPRFVRGKWGVAYDFKQFNNTPEKGAITTGVYQDILLSGSYKLGSRISGIATVGYEYKDSSDRKEIEKGITRSIGASWNPSRRFLVNATFGKRFYGNAKTMLIKYYRRRSVFNLKYTEDVTNDTGVIAEDNIENNLQAPDATATPDLVFPTVQIGVFVRKRFVADFNYEAKRGLLHFLAYNELRDYDDEAKNDEQIFGGVGTFEYNFGNATYFSLVADWSKTYFNDAITEDVNNAIAAKDERIDFIRKGEMSINRLLSPSSKVKLAYSYIERVSNERQHEYSQNVITANIDIVFDNL